MSERFGSGPPMIPHNVSPKRKRARRDNSNKDKKKPPPQQLVVSHLLSRSTRPLNELQGPQSLIASELPEGFPPEFAYRALAAYSLIRTLSIQLRLSPFTPNVFLRALMLPYPDRLLGKVHVALLRVLLPYLKMGYSYRQNGGGLCVAKRRRGDGVWWDLRGGDNLAYLDGYTWPLFYDDYVHLTADHLWELMNDDSKLLIDDNSFVFESSLNAENDEEQQERPEKRTTAPSSTSASVPQLNGNTLPTDEQPIAGIQTSPMQARKSTRTRQLSPPPVDSDSDVAVDSGSEFDSDMEEEDDDDDDDEEYGAMPRKRPRGRPRTRPRRNAATSNGNRQAVAVPQKKSPPAPGSQVLEADVAVSPGVFVSLPSQSSMNTTNSSMDSRVPANGKSSAKRNLSQQSVPTFEPGKPATKRMKPNAPNANVTAVPYMQTPIYLPPNGRPVPPANPKVMNATQLQNSMAPISKPPAMLLNPNGTPRAMPMPAPTINGATAPARPSPHPIPKLLNATQLQNSATTVQKAASIPAFLRTNTPPATNGNGLPGRPVVSQWRPGVPQQFGMPPPAPQASVRKPYSALMSGNPPQVQAKKASTVPQVMSAWKPNIQVKVTEPELPRLDPAEPDMNAYAVPSECVDSIQCFVSGGSIPQTKESEPLRPPTAEMNNKVENGSGPTPNISGTNEETSKLHKGGGVIATETTLEDQAKSDCVDGSHKVETETSERDTPLRREPRAHTHVNRETFPHEPDEWPQFTPIKAMRNGVPYHRLPLEEKLKVLEFLLDELLSVDSVAFEFGTRGFNLDRQYHRYGDLPSKEELDSLVNQDDCGICGGEGELLCCDGCIRSYHGQCIGMTPGTPLPGGKWLCPECATVDPARFGTLQGGQKASLDWFSLDDIKERDRKPSGDNDQAARPQTHQMKNVEFLVVHGFVFARQVSDKCDAVSSSKASHHDQRCSPNQYLPLAPNDLYRLLQSIGPNNASRWPFAQIPMDPSKLWRNVYEPERTHQMVRYFAHRESFDPSFQLNLYRFAPLPLSMESKGSNKSFLLLSDYETQCCVADMRTLSKALSRDMSQDIEIVRHLRSNTLLFNPYEMVASYLVNLETSFRRAYMLHENWAIRDGVYDPRQWHREVRECRSVRKLATMLVGLIDACHSRVFLGGWTDVASTAVGSKKEMYDTSSSTDFDGRRYETIPDGWTPEGEMTRRRWERARDSNILSLLSKDSFHLDGSAHTAESLAAKLGRKRKDDATARVKKGNGTETTKCVTEESEPSIQIEIDSSTGTSVPQQLQQETAKESTSWNVNANTNNEAVLSPSTPSQADGVAVGDTPDLPQSKDSSENIDAMSVSKSPLAPLVASGGVACEAEVTTRKPSIQQEKLHSTGSEGKASSGVARTNGSSSLKPLPTIPSDTTNGAREMNSSVRLSTEEDNDAPVASADETLQTNHKSSPAPAKQSEAEISRPTERSAPDNIASESLCTSSVNEVGESSVETSEESTPNTVSPPDSSVPETVSKPRKPAKRRYKKKVAKTSKRTRRSGRLQDRPEFSDKIGSIVPSAELLSLEAPASETDFNGKGQYDPVVAVDNERKRRLNHLEELVVQPGENTLHWPLAGRKLFEPVGYLPPSEMRRLGRNAGLVTAEFVRYTTSEVGEVSLYHAWRKRMLLVNSFDDLIAQIRTLDSFIDKETQHSCESIGRRTSKAKSQIQKKVLFKQRDIKTGAMLYFIVNESRGKRRGCWTTSENIDLSALILERSIRIDAKFIQCEQKKTPTVTSVASRSYQVAPQVRKTSGGAAATSTKRTENLPNGLPLATQLAQAKAKADIEGTLLQHEVDTGRLIVRSRELGVNVIPPADMASIRVQTMVKLKRIFAVLEQYGSSRKSESFILSLLTAAENAASEKFKQLESLYQPQASASKVTLGGLDALAGRTLTTSSQLEAPGPQQSAPLNPSTQPGKSAEPQSVENDALAGAYLGTAYLDTGKSVHNDKLLYADTSDARAVEAAKSLTAKRDATVERSMALAALKSNHDAATASLAARTSNQPVYGDTFVGDQTVNNGSHMALSQVTSYPQSLPPQQQVQVVANHHPTITNGAPAASNMQAYHQSFPLSQVQVVPNQQPIHHYHQSLQPVAQVSNQPVVHQPQIQVIPNQQMLHQYQLHQTVAQVPNQDSNHQQQQQYAAFQPPPASTTDSQAGVPDGTSATAAIPEGYNMQDLTPRPIEEMQKHPTEQPAVFNGHGSAGGQWDSH